MFNIARKNQERFHLLPEDSLRVERYRRSWLYYAPPGGNPYARENGMPTLAEFADLPDYTSGIFNYVPFIVNADLHLLLGSFELGSVSCASGEQKTARVRELLAGASFGDILQQTLLSALVCGDAYVKVIPDPTTVAGVRMVVLDAAAVHPRLDPHDSSRIRELLIEYRFRDEDRRLRRHAEVWDAARVEVRVDDIRDDSASGSHPFGEPPIVHFACLPLPCSFFGRPTWLDVLPDIDRLNSAAGAVFETFRYYGAPKLVLKGVMAPDLELDPDVRQFWQIPAGDGDISFLEWRNANGLVDELLKLDTVVRRKMPEFVLESVSERYFPSSGFAISLQMSLLEAKISALANSFRRSASHLVKLAALAAGIEIASSDVNFNSDAALVAIVSRLSEASPATKMAKKGSAR